MAGLFDTGRVTMPRPDGGPFDDEARDYLSEVIANARRLVTDPVGHVRLQLDRLAEHKLLPFLEAAKRGDTAALVEGLLASGVAGPLATKLSPSKAQAIVARTLDPKYGGSTTDLASGKILSRGNAVADVGPRVGIATGEAKQTVIPADKFNVKTLNEALQKDPRLQNADVLGTWFNKADGKVYLDPVDILQRPMAARLETQRGKQLAYYDLHKRAEGYGSLDPVARIAMRKAAEKTAAMRKDVPITVPEGQEFWPWRVEPGKFVAAQDAKGWFPQRMHSAGEMKLQEAIAKAEKELEQPGGNIPVWDWAKMKRPEQQGMRLNYSQSVEGTPQWILEQYGPQYEKTIKNAALKVGTKNPDAWKFYWTGQLQDDYKGLLGSQAGQQALNSFSGNLGATTASARPVQNVRMASYQDVRQAQGLPLASTPPYPYGHRYYSGTHSSNLEDMINQGRLDPMTNPKGATFAGDISGESSDFVMDKVMSNATNLRNQAGRVLDAPHTNAYDVPVDVGRKITRDLARTKGKIPPEVQQGLQPMDVQSVAWSEFGGDPSYARTLLQHISDRINVTSKVTGLPVDVVKQLFLEKKIPLLTVGGLLGFGGSGSDEDVVQ